MEFNKLPVIMQRYSLESILGGCTYCAEEIMNGNSLNIHKPNSVHPWELEVILLFALMVEKKYQANDFEGKNRRKFYEIVNCIRDYLHPSINIENFDIDTADKYMMVLGLTQFPLQQDIRQKFYRYNYFFNFQNEKIDLKSIFVNFFGVYYKEFMIPAHQLYTLYSVKDNRFDSIKDVILRYVIRKNHTALSQLMIDRKDFINKQSHILKDNIDNYYYSFKYFYQYPFIKCDDKTYFPLPYLIVNATTDSLLFRLTEDNNDLRILIGKEVIENYLYYILKNSCAYNEIYSEQKYHISRNNFDSPDVLARKDNIVILFDSKSSVPLITLREFDNSSVEHMIEIYAKSICQIYKQIINFNYYNPFIKDIVYTNDNIFGVIAILEDSNIRRVKIYEFAAMLLGIELDSIDYKYMCSNIIIIPLREVEHFALYSNDFAKQLIERRDNVAKWNDLTLIKPSYKKGAVVKDYEDFIKELKENIFTLTNELADHGILRK